MRASESNTEASESDTEADTEFDGQAEGGVGRDRDLGQRPAVVGPADCKQTVRKVDVLGRGDVAAAVSKAGVHSGDRT